MSEPKKEEMPAVAALLLCIVLVAAPVIIGEVEEIPQVKVVGYSVLVGVFMAFLGYLKSNPLEQFSQSCSSRHLSPESLRVSLWPS